MSNFTTRLILEYLPEANLWKTQSELVYFVGCEDSDWKIVVPIGFVTDLASIPWPISSLLPKSGRYNSASVLHDFICREGVYDRKMCDYIMLEAMEVLKVSWIKRHAIYRGLRMFGWIHTLMTRKKNV